MQSESWLRRASHCRCRQARRVCGSARVRSGGVGVGVGPGYGYYDGYYDYGPRYRSYAYDDGYTYRRHCRVVREDFNGYVRKVRRCW